MLAEGVALRRPFKLDRVTFLNTCRAAAEEADADAEAEEAAEDAEEDAEDEAEEEAEGEAEEEAEDVLMWNYRNYEIR